MAAVSFFPSGVTWTHAGRRFGLDTRTRVALELRAAVAREPADGIVGVHLPK